MFEEADPNLAVKALFHCLEPRPHGVPPGPGCLAQGNGLPVGPQGSQLSPMELLPLCWNATLWVAQPGEWTGVILEIAELRAQGAKSRAGDFQRDSAGIS